MNHRLSMICLAVAGAGSMAHAGEPDRDLLIRNVLVVSPERETRTEPTDVLVRGGRIALIGRDPSRETQTFTKVIEGAGRYLTPGLIDGHTHLNEIPGMTTEHESAYPDIARDARRQIPRSYLYFGFTTVVDLNSVPEVIAEWNEQDVRPQAHFCGAAPMLDGYPMSFMPKPARYQIMPYFLFDQARSGSLPDGMVAEDHTPAAVAKRIRNDGGICVKTHFERGFGGRGNLPVPSPDTIRDLVAAAGALGMPVLLHANSQSAQAFGLGTGVDAFAHGMWTWDDRTATELNADVTRILDDIIQRRIAWQPTIQVLFGERELQDPSYLTTPELREVLPQSLIDWYGTEDGQWWRNRMAGNPHVADLVESGRWNELDAEPLARVGAALSYLASNGGLLMFGSDTPSDPTFANPPGLNGRLEMRRWIDAGVTPAQLFRAATIVNATFFGLQEEIGTIEEGKRADLLLMTRNPMLDGAAFDAIDIVILRGRVLRRSELSAKQAR